MRRRRTEQKSLTTGYACNCNANDITILLCKQIGRSPNTSYAKFPVFAAGSVGEMAIDVGDAAVLGDWMTWMMWRVSVGKPVTGSLERQTS